MENEILKMLIEEIKEERELRKKLLQKLDLLNSFTSHQCISRGMAREDYRIVTAAEKPNSYVFGIAANRFKIYFENDEDAEKAIDACKRIEEYKDKKFKGGDNQ